MKLFLQLFAFIFISHTGQAQNLSFSCPKNLVLGCGVNCFDLTVNIPDIKQQGDNYVVKKQTNLSCYPIVDPGAPGPSTNLIIDDKYSSVINLPFPFVFYGVTYNSLVASTNGLVSFDVSNTGGESHWGILNLGGQLDDNSGTPENLPSMLYDRAIIMGPYHDMNPEYGSSPTKQIKYNTVGVAPHRKWILTFFKVPLYNCQNTFQNTSQIILHEGTNIVEVNIIDKQICNSWNQGRAMVGMQDMDKTNAIMAPGRAASNAPWGAVGMNEVWTFIPSNGNSLYDKMELLDGSGAVIANGDTTRVDETSFTWTFPNVCPSTDAPTLYVVKTSYKDISDPTKSFYSLDTVWATKNALPVSATFVNTTCGASTGAITVKANGGTEPYQFILGNGAAQASNIFTGLAAGTYDVKVVDDKGCTNHIEVKIGTQGSLNATHTFTNASCPGVNDGSITITPTTGTAPFTYSVNGAPVQTSNIFTNLTPGTYIIDFFDVLGCNGRITRTITPGSNINGNVTSTSTTCSTVNNGTITANGLNGVAPYTYSIDGINFQTSGVFNGLAPNSYIITVKDSRGCTINLSRTILIGSGLTVNPSQVNPTCITSTNGSITVFPLNGTAPFNYTINGSTPQTNNTFTGLGVGTYVIGVSDANGCTSSFTRILNGSSGITSTIATNASSCSSASNGSIAVTPTNGEAPYAYSIDGINFQSSNIFTGLLTGNYTITIRDVNNCIGTKNAAVSAGAGISATYLATSTTCAQLSDGTVTATVANGTGPYNYSIDGGTVQTGNLFTNIASGSHSITIVDANNCNTIITANVVAGNAPTTTAISTSTSCPALQDGTITITPPGNGINTYTLNPGNIVQTSPIFTGLANGTYTISFVAANGCAGSILPNPVVAQGAMLASTVTINQAPVCAGIDNGNITINPAGTAPFIYTLTPGSTQTSGTFTNLAPGNYSYRFSDATGCIGIGTFFFIANTPLATPATVIQPLCNGTSTGSVKFSPKGAVAPYQYALLPSTTFQTNNQFNGLASGIYTFRIKDNVGCSKDTTIILTDPSILTATATNTRLSSCTGIDGEITIQATGGTAPYKYSIDNGVTYQNVNYFMAPNVGLFPNIKVKDANGCIASTSTTVGLNDNMYLDLGLDQTICIGQDIVLKTSTNPETNLFTWTAIGGSITTLSNPLTKSPTATPINTTTYNLVAKWGVCERTDQITISILNKPIVNAGLDTAICKVSTQNIVAQATLIGTATNLSGNVIYSWTPVAKVETPDLPITIAKTDTTQQFILTVKDDYGCNFEVSDTVTVFVQPPVPAFAGRDTIAMYNRPHQLMASGGMTYIWNPSSVLNNNTLQNPLATLIKDTRFIVTVKDIAGCAGYDTVFVKVYEGPQFLVPNAFSPNADGRNDIFRPIPSGIKKIEYFRVFNRKGQLMFETREWLKGWDGTYQGKLQPTGSYVWIARGYDDNGRVIDQKGNIILL